MAIHKSAGKTVTEQFLAGLCEKSFLKLWSYPNPHRDDGKELCDLLAVFENQVFIFVDRESRRLQSYDATLTDWNRWKREAVDAQVRSVHGVERYLKMGRPVFLDSNLKVPFPVNIDLASATFYKIVVAHGAKEACEKFSPQNVYGSLAISYADQDVGSPVPFMIHLDRRNPVHVFDSQNLPIVLGELDTIHDFSSYLEAKHLALQKYAHLSYCGEEDLLAHYLYNLDETNKRHFIGPKDGDYDSVMIGEGEWKDFIQLPQYKNKKRADEVSELWDDLIQRTAGAGAMTVTRTACAAAGWTRAWACVALNSAIAISSPPISNWSSKFMVPLHSVFACALWCGPADACNPDTECFNIRTTVT